MAVLVEPVRWSFPPEGGTGDPEAASPRKSPGTPTPARPAGITPQALGVLLSTVGRPWGFVGAPGPSSQADLSFRLPASGPSDALIV